MGQYVAGHQEEGDSRLICEQLYDLAKIRHAPLESEAMAKFIQRSNEIMLMMTK